MSMQGAVAAGRGEAPQQVVGEIAGPGELGDGRDLADCVVAIDEVGEPGQITILIFSVRIEFYTRQRDSWSARPSNKVLNK